MDRRPHYRATGEHVYRAVKMRVVACEFAPGRRIHLEPVAARLGVSTTPVREALNRLAAEDLVVKAPRKGYFARRMTRRRVLGHYELTRLLLTHELERTLACRRRMPADFEPIASVLHKLRRHEIADLHALAAYNGDVFAGIASFGENAGIVHAVERANDQLHYVRTLECRLLSGVQRDLARLCELLLAERCDDARRAIDAYHERRTELLPDVLAHLSEQELAQ
ncbi:MAG: GntR family transcriptional regulator [Proteobacteria bacterium]|nr:GntR family transcriptional regulator [Pseudomonadota bacterium]